MQPKIAGVSRRVRNCWESVNLAVRAFRSPDGKGQRCDRRATRSLAVSALIGRSIARSWEIERCNWFLEARAVTSARPAYSPSCRTRMAEPPRGILRVADQPIGAGP
jgi:hypothetical protein